MGNQVTIENFIKGETSVPSTATAQGSQNTKTLKTSETEPYLHMNFKGQKAQTSKHSHSHSLMGGAIRHQSQRKAILSNMTSRVLLKEQMNESSQLNSFFSVTDLHQPRNITSLTRDTKSFHHQHPQAQGFGQIKPFQNISNIANRPQKPQHSRKCPPQPLSNQHSFSNNTNTNDRYQQQENQNSDQPSFQLKQQHESMGRIHSKSAHLSASQTRQNWSSQKQSPYIEEKVDFFKMQQRLLKRLKQSKKKTVTAQQGDPTRASNRYQNDQSVNSKRPPIQIKHQISPEITYDYQQLMPTSPPTVTYPQLTLQNTKHTFQATPQAPVRTLKFGAPGQTMPADVVMSLISYDSFLFIKFLMLSPQWHTSVLQAIDENCNKIENQFIQTYHEFLFYKQSLTTSMPIKFCRTKGIRIDRVIECEIMANRLLANNSQTLTFGYSYKVFGDSRVYRAEYKLDIVKKGKNRLTWIHQDKINRETYTQPIQQVCAGDSVEFALSLVSLQGYVEQIEWEPPVLVGTPKLSVTNYNKDWMKKIFQDSRIKIYCDLNRICEIEDAVVEWYQEAYYQHRAQLHDLTYLRENFDIRDVQYAGVDGAICKAVVVPKKEGLIPKERLGIAIEIKSDRQELVNEVKRIGYMKDRECGLQLRVGDTLMIYISSSNA